MDRYYQKIKYICYECDKHYATLYFKLYNPLKNYRIFKKNKKIFHLEELQMEEYSRCIDCSKKDLGRFVNEII